MSRTAESTSRKRNIISNDEKSADQLGGVVSEEGLLVYLCALEELDLVRVGIGQELDMSSQYESETSMCGQGKWGIMWVKGMMLIHSQP